VPMLTSPVNQQGWPDVVAKEVTENLHKFVSNGESLRPPDESIGLGPTIAPAHHLSHPVLAAKAVH